MFRVKYAYLQTNLDDWTGRGSYARFGIQQTPYLDFLESIYRYRFQGTMFTERIGLFASADAGVSYRYQFGWELRRHPRRRLQRRELQQSRSQRSEGDHDPRHACVRSPKDRRSSADCVSPVSTIPITTFRRPNVSAPSAQLTYEHPNVNVGVRVHARRGSGIGLRRLGQGTEGEPERLFDLGHSEDGHRLGRLGRTVPLRPPDAQHLVLPGLVAAPGTTRRC